MTNNRRIHKKPTGKSGPVFSGFDEEGRRVVRWDKFERPEAKSQQEYQIAKLFADVLNSTERADWIPETLPENDFDIIIRSSKGEIYVELLEIVFPSPKRGNPFDKLPGLIKASRYADFISEQINHKRMRYPVNLEHQLYLLIYVTHWAFEPNTAVLKIVSEKFKDNLLPFSCIHFIRQTGQNEAQLVYIVPPDAELASVKLRDALNSEYYNLDPGKLSLI